MGLAGYLCRGGGVLTAVAIALLLYPMAQLPSEMSWTARLMLPIVKMIIPREEPFTFCNILAYLTGETQFEVARRLTGASGRGAQLDSVVTESATIAGVPVRIYRPKEISTAVKLPAIVHFHGGGFHSCGLDSHHPFCLRLCDGLQSVVVAVAFRLAPEHIYPAAFNDSFAVTDALAGGEGSRWGIDSAALTVVGDSSGGTFAAGVALAWRRTSHPPLRGQVLIYPALQLVSFSSPSYVDGMSYGFSGRISAFSFSTYLWGDTTHMNELMNHSFDLLPEETWDLIDRRISGEKVNITMPPRERYPYAERLLSPLVSPLLADSTAGVAPAIILLAGFDTLRSDGERYARKLEADGVDVELITYKHQVHGFHATVSLPTMPFLARQFVSQDSEDLLYSIRTFFKRTTERN